MITSVDYGLSLLTVLFEHLVYSRSPRITSKMKLISVAIFIAFCEISSVTSSRILVLFPTPSKSHVITVQGLSTALVNKGHEVTVVSPFPLGKKMKNYRDIQSPLSDEVKSFNDGILKNPKKSMIVMMPEILRIVASTGKDMMEMPEFKRIMKEEKFDLVIIGMFMNNYLLGYGDHFKCPTMMMSAAGAFTFTNMLFGNPLEVSAVSHIMSYTAGKMNFWERLKSFVAYGFDLALHYYLDYKQRIIYE